MGLEVYAASSDDGNDLEEAPDEIRRVKRPPVAALYNGSNAMRTKAQAPSVKDDDTNREAEIWFWIKVGCGLAALGLILSLSLGLSLSDTDPGDCPAGFSRLLIEGGQYDEICKKNGDLYDFCCRDDPTDPVRWRLSLAPLIDYDAACPAGYSQFYTDGCASTCGCNQPDASDKTSLTCDMCCKNDDGKCTHHDPDCPAGFSRMRIENDKYDTICVSLRYRLDGDIHHLSAGRCKRTSMRCF
uniref:Uncharacterized protein n=1 Tax=Hondaea fermentalgiana TaxID=2315210 RepID=A0A2R5GYD9_9STRA|nr:Hypothetical Protein FCC1311_099662 [Hondaea fermentalgiana]|eukprot:GBG33743.1 Hypothetical Protein FCC1311_099662 [Hondaea fermentalgiana]